MYTLRIFKSKDGSRETVKKSLILADELSVFMHLIILKNLYKNDIEVYSDDMLYFTGCVGHFIYSLLDEFKEKIDKEMK